METKDRISKIETAICILETAGIDGSILDSLKNRIELIRRSEK
jgi:hypothetical protein